MDPLPSTQPAPLPTGLAILLGVLVFSTVGWLMELVPAIYLSLISMSQGNTMAPLLPGVVIAQTAFSGASALGIWRRNKPLARIPFVLLLVLTLAASMLTALVAAEGGRGWMGLSTVTLVAAVLCVPVLRYVWRHT